MMKSIHFPNPRRHSSLLERRTGGCRCGPAPTVLCLLLALLVGLPAAPAFAGDGAFALEQQGRDQFDFFLGRWRAENRWMQPDQSINEFTTNVFVSAMLNGNGLFDDNYIRNGDGETYFGTAQRTYDAENNAWICRWYDAKKAKWGAEFILRFHGDVIQGTMAGSDQHGDYVDTISFFDIEQDRFSWKMMRRYDTLDRDLMIGQIAYTRVSDREQSE
jgi:hypothetical protein